MSVGITIAPAPPSTSPGLKPFHLQAISAAAAISTSTHLANLDRLLQKSVAPLPPPPPPKIVEHRHRRPPPLSSLPDLPFFPFFSSSFHSNKQQDASGAGDQISPLALALLSDSARPSPRGSISASWRRYHGEGDWEGLLDPLDRHLRRELVRYGDLVHAAYRAFHSQPSRPPVDVVLPDRSYRVTRHLFATASIDLPTWLRPSPRTSWIGFVAVCDSEREISRMGRRDIVVALRGTATWLEWAENFRSGLVDVGNSAKVACGFRSLYKTAGTEAPSLSEAVVEEVRRLTELYAGEELSVTMAGHSLGAALAVLAAEEVAQRVPTPPPTAVFSFGGPRVGNRAFAERVEARGVKVLRAVNSRDVVPRVPPEGGGAGYAHVGKELRLDSRTSPYLRPDADPMCCHDLEAYLHLVDGYIAAGGPFRRDAKRSLARLVTEQSANVKKRYVSVAHAAAREKSTPASRLISRCSSASSPTIGSSLSIENVKIR
ncbi:phospholipase A1-Ibeta2, chloroplastic-like [Zingiber officinale]|uniref:Fungal lipase-type domain-containing protein n=1 Tax=Zingiber officinale TaxID=94328 RepID=A0A8J5CQR5_ZINOF|nr:phospholipase A1-Ibeta2, chloroplastic-like [Zingiber officinale]KAG6467329.1 hypothetical protein ZIOFF_074886 [Zingiber officinale]